MESFKPVFHFNRIVTYRSILFCIEVISSTLVLRKQRNTLRFGTKRLKWKTGFKPVFHFNRIVAKRSVFLCFLTTRVELMTSTQKKMLRYVTIRLKWKTGLINCTVPYRTPYTVHRTVLHRTRPYCTVDFKGTY